MLFRRTNPWGKSRSRPMSIWTWVLVTIIFVFLLRAGVPIPSIWSWISPGEVIKMAVPVLLLDYPNSHSPNNRQEETIDDKTNQSRTKNATRSLWVGSIGLEKLNLILENQIPALAEGTNQINVKKLTNPQEKEPGIHSDDEQGYYITEKEGEDFPDVDIPREDPRGETVPEIPENNQPGTGTPVVLIYHTHNAETYGATDKKPRLDGKNGGVYLAGQKLAERLQTKQIRSIHSDTIHDYPSYDFAYNQSQKTIQDLLRRYPNPLAVLDIHRDALPQRETVTIGGRKVAKILFIVGTNARVSHPYWKRNLEFAETVSNALEELYPGLSKGIMTKAGRYHQQLHPRALLVEIGSDKNSTPEAVAAAELLADAIAKVLKGKHSIPNQGRQI